MQPRYELRNNRDRSADVVPSVAPWAQPPVIGEILAGILLGPSLFVWIAPAVFAALFPGVHCAVLVLYRRCAATPLHAGRSRSDHRVTRFVIASARNCERVRTRTIGLFPTLHHA
jgi:hypothetical protein